MFKKDVKKIENKSQLLSNKDKLDAAKKENVKAKERFKWKNRKLYIVIAVSIVIIAAIITGLSVYLNSIKYKDYVKYEEKMKTYGFDKLYNNQSAKTNESVTKAEALKLAIAAVFNKSDISDFAAEHNEYENAIWVEYAKDTEVTKEDININNFNDKAKYLDVITYFENCKKIFLKDQAIKNVDVKFKDISKYTIEQQTMIKDMVANEIIYEVFNKLDGKSNIVKGQLNELVVNFVEKYNTITMSGDKININPEKMPSNANQYPYTITTVDKSVYEKPFFSEYSERAMSAKELYSIKKENYSQVKTFTEEFFNVILNVDYKTITEESLRESLENYFIFVPNESAVKAYVKHVKDNEIVIQGNAKLQVPAIYFDGVSYRARMKLNFDIKNSKTKDNLLYLDLFDGLKKTYEKNSYEIFVDYYLAVGIGNYNIYLDQAELYNTILDKDKSGITKEVDNEIYIREEAK
ncbi:MAG: copper amine oxidase [Clostridia bacterium]|nr:copper amine oxidase [Clostridia bacterium]